MLRFAKSLMRIKSTRLTTYALKTNNNSSERLCALFMSSNCFSLSTRSQRINTSAAPAKTSIPKYSKNTSLASEVNINTDANDVPSYSIRKHMAYSFSNTKRIWTPVLLMFGYFTLFPFIPVIHAALPQLLMLLPAAAAAPSTTVITLKTFSELVTWSYISLGVLLQRYVVRGRIVRLRKNLQGCKCVITGGASGVGLYTTLELLNMGASVNIVDVLEKQERAQQFLLENCIITNNSNNSNNKDNSKDNSVEVNMRLNQIHYFPTDLSDQVNVMATAARIKGKLNNSIDLLINNAAVWKEQPQESKQGFEEHIATNFLGPFHLTEALLPALRRSTCYTVNNNTDHSNSVNSWKGGGRVVYVTCAQHVQVPNNVKDIISHFYNLSVHNSWAANTTARGYAASKLGNIYHAQFIANRRYDGLQFNSHPSHTQIAVEHQSKQKEPESECQNATNNTIDRTNSNSETKLEKKWSETHGFERHRYQPISVCIVDPGKCDTNLFHYESDIHDESISDVKNNNNNYNNNNNNNDLFPQNNALTSALRSLWRKTPWEGAQCVLYGCLLDDLEEGGYYVECKARTPWLSKAAQNSHKRDEVMRWAMAKTILKYYSFIKNETK